MRKSSNKLLVLCGWSFLIILWEVVAIISNNSILFPRLELIVKSIYNIMINSQSYLSFFNSGISLIIAVGLSICIALFLAIITLKFNNLRNFILPIITVLKSLPTIGVILIIIIWSELKNVPVLVGVIISLGIFYDGITGAIENTDKNIIKMLKLYKVNYFIRLRAVYIPTIYFSISSVLHSTISLIFKVIIAGEVLAQLDNTIGGELYKQKTELNTDNFFAWLIIVVLFSLVLDLLLKKIDKRIKKWEV